MKNAQQAKDTPSQKLGINAQEHHIKIAPMPSNSGPKQLIRRGVAPFPAAGSSIFEQEPQSAASMGDSNTSSINRLASNPRQAYQ